ncbi:MAG: hypothetical protein IJD04_09115 [Desulfovibrionaceae bacterium]|nr:hypothetical protein [Desulfovibrionaceae bacterium]
MQKIPLKYARAGMVLANPVQRDDGLVLVGPGTELTESILNRLLLSGISTVTVQGNPVPEIDGGDYNSLISNLDAMFRNWQGHRFMSALKNVLKNYFQTKQEEAEAARAAEVEAEAAENGESR